MAKFKLVTKEENEEVKTCEIPTEAFITLLEIINRDTLDDTVSLVVEAQNTSESECLRIHNYNVYGVWKSTKKLDFNKSEILIERIEDENL